MPVHDPVPHGHVLWDLIRTSRLAERRFHRVFAEFGLTPTQYGVLATLLDDKGVSAAELARQVMVRPQSLPSVIEALVAKGLVKRDGPPGRGRPKPLSLTAEGQRVVHRARPAAYSLLEPALLGLDEDDRRSLEMLLTRVTRALSEAWVLDAEPTPVPNGADRGSDVGRRR